MTSLPSTSLSDDALVSPGGRYVVGFDGSAASRTALAWAASRAASGGGRLELVGVADGEAGAVGQEYAQESALALAHLLSGTADDLAARHSGLRVATRLVTGGVVAALSEAPSPGDVLVVGSDKTGYLEGRVYGLRSLEFAALAATTLVVVPTVDVRLRQGVVVGLADTDALPRLVTTAGREASNRGASLHLVHAVKPASAPDVLSEARRLLARARSLATSECPGLEVASHLSERRPAEALLDASRQRALLMVGRSHTSSPLGVGGALQEVLLNLNAPTVVIG